MKTFTRVGLPILLVIGLVFGITFIQQYSSDSDSADSPRDARAKSSPAREQPLKIRSPIAAAPKEEPTATGEFRVPNNLRHLTYWDASAEVGDSGYYAFWCENPHQKPVTVRIPSTNCQCAGADLAAIPPDAFREYLLTSALAGSPLCPAPGPAAALAHLGLSRRLDWETLNNNADRPERTIPPAQPQAGSQWALIRLNWKGKDSVGPRDISADLYANLPEAQVPTHYALKADLTVVPAFELVRRTGPARWAPAREVDFGELVENSVVHQDFYVASASRTFLLLGVAAANSDPCVTWAEPVPASPAELDTLANQLRGGERPSPRPKCLYRIQVTVRERVDAAAGSKSASSRQLDLGLLEHRLNVSATNGGSHSIVAKARVRGDVEILSGSADGRIDLGSSFPADQDRTASVNLLAERSGLDLVLSEAETTPNYLKVKLEPRDQIRGRNQWRLTVTVPKGTLYGSIPEGSAVVLKTVGPNPRRFRIPVRGMTYDSGGPRL
ncbi:MAG TPA: hypothetical protein VKD90_25340 [Gemmataceae bacterium]|nr:hypothetical protein [Gemmataceae bacterium]